MSAWSVTAEGMIKLTDVEENMLTVLIKMQQTLKVTHTEIVSLNHIQLPGVIKGVGGVSVI